MFGIPIPRNNKQAYKFNKVNGNTAWANAITKEANGKDIIAHLVH